MSDGPAGPVAAVGDQDVVGAQRFLQRAWRLVVDEESGAVRVTDAQPTEDDLRALHKAIAGVQRRLREPAHQPAGAKLIELTNHLTKAYPAGAPEGGRRAARGDALAPLAPPYCRDELWERLGHGESLAHGPFPVADEQWLAQDSDRDPDPGQGQGAQPDHRRGRRRRGWYAQPHWPTRRSSRCSTVSRKVIVVPGRMVNVVPQAAP